MIGSVVVGETCVSPLDHVKLSEPDIDIKTPEVSGRPALVSTT
jgi:hypothetical protein